MEKRERNSAKRRNDVEIQKIGEKQRSNFAENSNKYFSNNLTKELFEKFVAIDYTRVMGTPLGGFPSKS